jgi:DNA polymerase elongation subunit (family B)
MSKEEKKYPNWNRIYGFLGNNTYRFYDNETAEKIKLKGQEILKELLEQRLNQNKDK